MSFSLRHIMLLIGILLVVCSFLWFGRDTDTYNLLLLIGLIVSSISFLFILLKTDTWKSKLISSFFVVAGFGLLWFSEPILIRFSCKIYLNKYQKELESVSHLLVHREDFSAVPNSDFWIRNGYTLEEARFIKDASEEIGIHRITKDGISIYYKTWGDARCITWYLLFLWR